MRVIGLILVLAGFFCLFGCVWQGTNIDNNTPGNGEMDSNGIQPLEQPQLDENASNVELISYFVTQIKIGGATLSQPFELKKGEIIKSSDLSIAGLNPNQLVFSICTCAGFAEEEIEAGVSENKEYSYLKSNLNSDLNIKVSIICDKNAKTLKALLDSIGKQANISPTELCPDDINSPCCVLYPKKA